MNNMSDELLILICFAFGVLAGSVTVFFWKICAEYYFKEAKKEFSKYFKVNDNFYSRWTMIEAVKQKKEIIYQEKINYFETKLEKRSKK